MELKGVKFRCPIQSDNVAEVSEVFADNLAATSASQPSASSCSGGARGSDAGVPQPAINRSNLSPIVTEILEFGRIPEQIKRPTPKEDHDENNLAKRFSKKKNLYLILTNFNSSSSMKTMSHESLLIT